MTPRSNRWWAAMTSRRQFLGAAAAAVSLTTPVTESETAEPETVEDQLKGTVEWKAAGVWEDHLIPARTALTKAGAVDVVEAKEELREALQKLEAIDVNEQSRGSDVGASSGSKASGDGDRR